MGKVQPLITEKVTRRREYKKTKDTSQYMEKIRTGTTDLELEHHRRPCCSF